MGRAYMETTFPEYGPKDYELAKKYADSLEIYLNEINATMILSGISKKKEKKAIKRVRKLIKHLRKGNLEKVYDWDAYVMYTNLSDDGY